MNILEIPVTGSSLNPDSTSQSKKSSDSPGGFDTILSTLISQLQDPGLVSDLNCKSLAKSNLLLLAGLGQVPESADKSVDGIKDLFSRLGDKLFEMLAKLFAGIKTGDNKNELLSILDGIINNLTEDGKTDIKNMLIKLLGDMKQSISEDGIESKLGKLAEGLPDAVKLKIRSAANKTGDSASSEGTDIIKYKLLISLLGLEGSAGTKADGAVPDTSETKIVMQLKEMLMEKFHINPEAVNGKSLVNNATSSSQDVARSESYLLANQANDKSGSIQAQDSSLKGNISQQIAGQAAGVKDAPGVETIKHNAESLALTKEASATTPIIGSPNTDKSSDDSKGSSSGTGNSQQPYGFVAESKPSFAADLAQKTVSAGGSQGPDARLDIGDPNQFIKQIVDKFDVLISGARSEAKIQLKPKYLGELKIHLTMEGGVMKAVLNASTQQAKHIIEANLINLKRSLEEQGLQIKEFNVSVGHHHENHGGQARQHRGSSVSSHERITMAGEIQDIKTRLSFGSDEAVNYLV